MIINGNLGESKNEGKSYVCDLCCYSTARKDNFERHLRSKKHNDNKLPSFVSQSESLLRCNFCNFEISTKPKMVSHIIKEHPSKNTTPHFFSFFEGTHFCLFCDYKTKRKPNMVRHLKSNVHLAERTKYTTHFEGKEISCKNCNKKYKYMSGLSRHLKTCKKNKPLQDSITNESVIELIKTNCELKNLIISQNEKIIELNNKPNNIINNNNTTYIENYLNIECKDAINISDFVKQLQIASKDLIYLSNYGFTQSVKNLMIDTFKNMDKTKRPVHCTNKRNKTIYVKDSNIWSKDKEYNKIKNVIQQIHNKELNSLIKYIDSKDEHYFDEEENTVEKNNMIINLTTYNKDNTIKDIIKQITQLEI